MVVPTLAQRGELLAHCISSIRAQRGVRVELVLSAPRERWAVLRTAFPDIPIVDAQSPGLSAAINAGMSELVNRCQYVSWLGDDDLLAPGALAAVADGFSDDETVAVYGRTLYVTHAGAPIYLARSGRFAVAWLAIGRDLLPQPGSLIRADAWTKVGGLDEALKNAMDLDLFLKLRAVGSLKYVRREVSAYRIHPQSITMSKGAADEGEAVRELHRTRREARWVRRFKYLVRFVDWLVVAVPWHVGAHVPRRWRRARWVPAAAGEPRGWWLLPK